MNGLCLLLFPDSACKTTRFFAIFTHSRLLFYFVCHMTSPYLSQSNDYFSIFSLLYPWEIVAYLDKWLEAYRLSLPAEDYLFTETTAVHKSANVSERAILKGLVVVGANSFVGANACLRDGVFVGKNCVIGMGSEVKHSLILDHSALAHFNYVGDSLIGSGVNLEAGAVIANHYNERQDKRIWVQWEGQQTDTGLEKFGALVGDGAKIGANAVLSPGTILEPGRVVGRLELV